MTLPFRNEVNADFLNGDIMDKHYLTDKYRHRNTVIRTKGFQTLIQSYRIINTFR